MFRSLSQSKFRVNANPLTGRPAVPAIGVFACPSAKPRSER